MSIHYKFKSNLNFDTLTFDGLHISVGDLKKAIIQQKRLGKVIDYDLQITNAQTKEEYSSDSHLIPKNTSLIISRVPMSGSSKKHCDSEEHETQGRFESKIDRKTLDLTRLNGSEEDKIQEMMLQSTVQYDPKSYQKFRTQSQSGEVPSTYKCNKCKRGGHWIKNCPLSNAKELIEVKRNTGIPRSFRDKSEKLQETIQADVSLPKQDKKIPDDLICSICKDLFVDAVMIPCCGSSFCDDCVRTALLESEENECPDCKEKGSSPGALIPNRFLRNSVNAFRNENDCISDNKKNSFLCGSMTDKNTVSENIPSKENVHNDASNEKNINDTIDMEDKTIIPNTKMEDNESDYEDNIIVKVPVVEIAKNGVIESIDLSTNNEYGMQKKIPKTDLQNICLNTLQTEDVAVEQTKPEIRKPSTIENLVMNSQRCEVQERRILPDSRMNSYQHFHIYPQLTQFPAHRGQSHGAFENFYNRPNVRPPLGYSNMVHQPINDLCPGYLPVRQPNLDIQKASNFSTFSNIYDGITAKLGTGIIDDPLEAFNRIMKEKEKEKEQKRRNIQRRSRSKDRQQRRQFRSPSYERRLSKQSNLKESRLHRKRHADKKYNQRYQRSNSAAHSRSRSRSPLPVRIRSSPAENRQSQYHRNPKHDKKDSIIQSSDKNKYRHIMYRPCIRQRETGFENLEPPPPGSDVQQLESKRNSRTRSSSLNRDEKFLKNKIKNKNSPKADFNSLSREDLRHYTPEPIEKNISEEFSYKKSENCTPMKGKDNDALDEDSKNFDVAVNIPKEFDKSKISNENVIIKIASKDDLKTEKKNKDRKKKKKDKEKLIKKKNKKGKKERRSIDKNKDFSEQTKLNEDLRKKRNTENSDLKDVNIVGEDQKFKCEDIREPPSKELKVSDSILDIQGYDTDFEDITRQEKNISQKDLTCKDKNFKSISSETTELVKVLGKPEVVHNSNQQPVENSAKEKCSPKIIRSVKERLGSKVVSNFEDKFQPFRSDLLQVENRKHSDLKRESIAWKQFKTREKWNSHNIPKLKTPPKEHIFKNTSKGDRNEFHNRAKNQSSRREFNNYNQIKDIKSVASSLSIERRPENPFRNKSNEYKPSSNSREHATNRMNSSNASSDESISDSSDFDREKKFKSKKKHKKRRNSISPDSNDSVKQKNAKNRKKHKIVKKKKKNKD